MKALYNKWRREIREVGIAYWVWFVVYLRRNSNSHKLDIDRYGHNMLKCIQDRERAAVIDKIFTALADGTWT